MRFRKRPIVVEALQLGWDNWSEMCEHAGVGDLADGQPQGTFVNDDGEAVAGFPGGDGRIGLLIPTLEGVMLAIEGDWVVRGAVGELYPCKPDAFAASFDPLPATPSDPVRKQSL